MHLPALRLCAVARDLYGRLCESSLVQIVRSVFWPLSSLEVVMSSSRLLIFSCASCLSWSIVCLAQERVSGPPLARTQALTMESDIAGAMVVGVDKFLLREIELSVERRKKFW